MFRVPRALHYVNDVQKAFKENVEREALTPIDEAGWFSKMLNMDEAVLFGIKSEHPPVGEDAKGGRMHLPQ